MLRVGKRQNVAKKGMVNWRGDLKKAKKMKNYSTYGKIKGTKAILLIYINYVDYAIFLVISFYFCQV